MLKVHLNVFPFHFFHKHIYSHARRHIVIKQAAIFRLCVEEEQHTHTASESVFHSPFTLKLRIVSCLHMISLEGFFASVDQSGDLGVV